VNERGLLAVLVAVQFTHIMDFMIMMPLGSHLMRVFEITPAQFSRLVAAYGITAAVAGFLGGFVLDRFDRKHALLTLYAGFGVATLGCALAPSYGFMLLARAAAGACGGCGRFGGDGDGGRRVSGGAARARDGRGDDGVSHRVHFGRAGGVAAGQRV
jgi:MFS family permease